MEQYTIDNEEKINENIKKECAELKSLYLDIMNKELQNDYKGEKRNSYIYKNINVPNLIQKYNLDYKTNCYKNPNCLLSNICNQEFSSEFIDSFEKNNNVKHYDSPRLSCRKTGITVDVDIYNIKK